MTAFSDARQAIADALDGITANVYAYPAPVISAPAVVVVVDSPMAEPVTIGSRLRLRANYRLQLCVGGADNLAALEAIEALVIDVLTALPPGLMVGAVTPPNVQQVGQAELVVSEIPIQIMAEEGN